MEDNDYYNKLYDDDEAEKHIDRCLVALNYVSKKSYEIQKLNNSMLGQLTGITLTREVGALKNKLKQIFITNSKNALLKRITNV